MLQRPRPKKRSAVVLALAGTFAVGLIAFPASSAAAPPLVPPCTPKASTDSDSCVTLKVAALDGSIGTTLENARLGFRTSSVLQGPAEVSTLTLRFDDQIALNLAGIPVCFPSEVDEGTNIAQAWEQCGPGADGNPPSEGNAYLSTGLGPQVSGIGSTTPDPGGALGCALVFRGPNWDPPPAGGSTFPTLTFYFRGFAQGATPSVCNNPATNTAGLTTLILQGFVTREGASSPYDWRLRIPNVQLVGPALDDFYWTVTRGATFRARCLTSTYKHKLVGIFDYTGTEPTDTIAPPYPGTTDTCP